MNKFFFEKTISHFFFLTITFAVIAVASAEEIKHEVGLKKKPIKPFKTEQNALGSLTCNPIVINATTTVEIWPDLVRRHVFANDIDMGSAIMPIGIVTDSSGAPYFSYAKTSSNYSLNDISLFINKGGHSYEIDRRNVYDALFDEIQRSGRGMVIDSNDRVHVVILETYVRFDADFNQLVYKHFPSHTNSIWIDSSDTLYISGGRRNVIHLYRIDNATGFTLLSPLISNLRPYAYPHKIAVDSRGGVHLVFYDQSVNKLKYYKKDVSGRIACLSIADVPTSVARYKTPSIAIDSNDSVHVLYENTELHGNATLTYITNIYGNWIAIPIVGSNGHLAIDSNNNVHIFYNNLGGSLMYRTNSGHNWTESLIGNFSADGLAMAVAYDKVHIAVTNGTVLKALSISK